MGWVVMLVGLGIIIAVMRRLYRKATADEAFVRTGLGGEASVIGW